MNVINFMLQLVQLSVYSKINDTYLLKFKDMTNEYLYMTFFMYLKLYYLLFNPKECNIN